MDGKAHHIPLDLPKDQMREGLTANKHTALNSVHPLQNHLLHTEKNDIKMKYFTLSHLYGSAMPIHMEMEKTLVSTPLRLPSLPTNNMAKEILAGNDEDMDFADYLYDPTVINHVDLHAAMEDKLGLKVNLRF